MSTKVDRKNTYFHLVFSEVYISDVFSLGCFFKSRQWLFQRRRNILFPPCPFRLDTVQLCLLSHLLPDELRYLRKLSAAECIPMLNPAIHECLIEHLGCHVAEGICRAFGVVEINIPCKRLLVTALEDDHLIIYLYCKCLHIIREGEENGLFSMVGCKESIAVTE